MPVNESDSRVSDGRIGPRESRVAEALFYEEPHVSSGNFSVTELRLPPRMVALSRLKGPRIRRWYSQLRAKLGTALHQIVEMTPKINAISEMKFVVPFRPDSNGDDGVNISFIPDELSLVNGKWVLRDFKTRSVRAVDVLHPEDELQLQFEAYLLRKIGLPVDRLINEYLLLDFHWRDPMINPATPYPVITHEYQIWPEEQTKDVLCDRVRQLRNALSAPVKELPLCTPEERWASPGGWLVAYTDKTRADGQPKAVPKGLDNGQLFLTEEAARKRYEELGCKSNHAVVFRPPQKGLRCLEFCPFALTCAAICQLNGEADGPSPDEVMERVRLSRAVVENAEQPDISDVD